VKKNSGKKRAKPADVLNDVSLTPSAVLEPFRPGAVVLVTLNNPREKLWGKILALDPAGLSLCGVELASFEDAINMFIGGEPLAVAALFFPMHRVERLELDLPSGTIPSLSQRFISRTGVEASVALANAPGGGSGR
jgi:hypothetical protein